MQADGARGGLDLGLVNFTKARNVFCHGAVKQFDPLRQITDMGAQFQLVPCEDVHAVKPNFAIDGWPQAHQQTRQSGLAGGRRTDHGQHVARLQTKADALENGYRNTGRTGNQSINLQLTHRSR